MARYEPDSCPGVLQVHAAADGPLVRVRLPGGALTSEQLSVLATAACELGDGNLQLTGRANVQLRAVRDQAALADRLRSAGLLPSESHERVRNIIASALSGLVGGLADIRPLVSALDEGLQAQPRLAELPGRVLFTVDDGRGDVSGLAGDIGVHAVGVRTFALLLAGNDSGLRLPREAVVEVALTAAARFNTMRGSHWRLHEVPHGAARVAEGLPGLRDTPREFSTSPQLPIGCFLQNDGHAAVGLAAPFGSVSATTATALAALDRPVIVTAWRGVVVTDLDQAVANSFLQRLEGSDRATPPELITDPDSPWLLITACIGQPGCAKSLADVRADATAAVTTGTAPDNPQHWAGCHRRCGRPRGTITDVIATDHGYQITGRRSR